MYGIYSMWRGTYGLPVKTSWEGGFFQTSVFAGAENVKVDSAAAIAMSTVQVDVITKEKL